MAAQKVCLFNRFGYCRYQDVCRKLHVDELCEYSSCEFSKCILRHPKECKWYRKYKRCKFNPCKYSHKDEIGELKVDSQKAFKKISNIEKILEERDILENKIKEFEIKIDALGKEIEKLEITVVEKDAALMEEVTQIDANTDILRRLEELEKTNLVKDAQIKFIMDRVKNLDVKVIEHNDVQENVDVRKQQQDRFENS